MPEQLISIWIAVQSPTSTVLPLQNKNSALPQKQPFFGVHFANGHQRHSFRWRSY
jgi:3-dehydroquinate dehydratase